MSTFKVATNEVHALGIGGKGDRFWKHDVAWTRVLSRGTVAFFALLLCLPASPGFRYLTEDVSEQSSVFRHVSSGIELVAAVDDGVRHIVITDHLDLTDLSKGLPTLTNGVVATIATSTIQGMCESAALVGTQEPLPSTRTCVLDVHEDFLEATNSTSALLLSHLYVRLSGSGGRSFATLILNKAPALWLSHVVLEGNGLAVRGMDVYENSRLFIADSSMSNFARSFGSAIKLRGNVTAGLERVMFSNNTIIAETGRSQQYGPDLYVGAASTALLRAVQLSAVTTPDIVTAAVPAAGLEAGPEDALLQQLPPLGGTSVAKLNGRASVYVGVESGIRVYDVDADNVTAAEVATGTPESVLTADDEWYTDIMQEWETLMQQHPFFPPGEPDDQGTGAGAGGATDGADADDETGSDPDAVSGSADGQDGGGGMPDLVLMLVALAVGLALMIGLCVLAAWVYRKVQIKKKQELAAHDRRSKTHSDEAPDTTGSVAFPSEPLRETASQASTGAYSRSKSYGVFAAAQAVPGVPQHADSAQQERSTGFTRTGSLHSVPSSTTTIPVPAMILTNQRMGAHQGAGDPSATPTTPASRSSPTRTRNNASSGLTPIPGAPGTAIGGGGGSPHGAPPHGGQNIRSASTSSSSISNSVNLQTPTASGATLAGGVAAGGMGARTMSGTMSRRTSDNVTGSALMATESAPFIDAELTAALDEAAAAGPHADTGLCDGRYTPLGATQRRMSGSGVVQFAVARDTGAPVALKFFSRRAAFLRTEALYKHSPLSQFMPHVLAIESTAEQEDSAGASVAIADSAEAYMFPPCIVMERGESLRDWALGRRPEFEERLAALAVVAERVRALHEAGFAHRNLKPDNLLLRASDQSWRLIDFACAARIGTRASLPRSLLYAPPEWAQAAEAYTTMVPADPAADIWAFGVTAYELFTGHRLFPVNAPDAAIRDALAGRTGLPWEHPSTFPDMAPGAFREFGVLRRMLRCCLSRSAVQRPTAKTLVQELLGKLQAIRGTSAVSTSGRKAAARR